MILAMIVAKYYKNYIALPKKLSFAFLIKEDKNCTAYRRKQTTRNMYY
jgi:hypothetical protein